METSKTLTATNKKSVGILWTGRIFYVISILFLLFDSISKILNETHSVEGTVHLGWPEQSVPVIGMILLSFTIIYIIPRTAVLGAVLLTAYLGGATATLLRLSEPYFFPIIFAFFVWGGIIFRNEKIRKLIID